LEISGKWVPFAGEAERRNFINNKGLYDVDHVVYCLLNLFGSRLTINGRARKQLTAGGLHFSRHRILVFDKAPSVRHTLGLVLGREDEVEAFAETGEFLGRLARGGADLGIIGLEYPFPKYLPFLQAVRREDKCLPLLFLSTKPNGPEAPYPLSAVLMKPFFPGDLQEKVKELLARGKEGEGSAFLFAPGARLGEKIRRWLESGRVEADVRERVERLSSVPLAVLIEGEEGTGKSWVARGLHCLGAWSGADFVRFSGKGLEKTVFLEELRGRVRGADGCRGLDLYIEGVEDLTREMQEFLVEQEEEGWIGEELAFGAEVPVRVLGSSGAGFGESVRNGDVRRDFGDLYWGARIRLKPLRERAEEIGAIAKEILREGGSGKRASGEALEELGRYEWPGNMEELETLVVRTGALAEGGEIEGGEWEWSFKENGGGGKEKGRREEGKKKEARIENEGQKGGKEEKAEKIEEEGKGEKERAGVWRLKKGGGEALEVLLSTLVHEVKNPLVAISTFAHLLPERYEEEEFRGEFSRLVGLEVKRLNGVLEMLLEYVRLGAPQKGAVDLQRRVLASLGEYKREISEKEILIRKEGLENLPPVDFDEEQMKFVLRNIWESVLGRETGNREGAVIARLRQNGEAREWAELEIRYGGRDGIVKDIHQVEVPGGRYDVEGLNLGLGLARRLMVRNGSEMQVFQEEEVGTTILLRFPRTGQGH
jgi:DNA-binding NtrC family response regulator